MRKRGPWFRPLNHRNPFYQFRPNVVVAIVVAAWVVHLATRLVSESFSEAMALMSSDVPENVREGANTLLGHLLGLQVHTLAITGLFALAGKFAERTEEPVATVPAETHHHVIEQILRKVPDADDDEDVVRDSEQVANHLEKK